MDRDTIIDAVYLGKGKPSTIQQHINWYHGWSIDQEDDCEPSPAIGPTKDEDIAEASRTDKTPPASKPATNYPMIVADIFEGLYPGSSELYKQHVRELPRHLRSIFELDAVRRQSSPETRRPGKYPGQFPIWVGAGTGDPDG